MGYKVGDKFVVEIEEVFKNDTEDLIQEKELYRMKGFNSLVMDENGLDKLDRLDSDYVNDDFGELQDEAYTAGADASWELASKLAKCSCKELDEMHFTSLTHALVEHGYREALEKVAAYEKEQNEIHVGDVVDHDGLKSVVVRVADNIVYAVTSFGTTPCYAMDYVKLKKTGQHIDISSILSEIGRVRG